MNRAVFASLTILCLLSVSSIAGLIQVVKADGGTIYIGADGSVAPSTAPISSVDNVTYIFTGNVNESIVIERDSIVVDGAGYAVMGSGSGNGITLTGRSNLTVRNVAITNFYVGIWLGSSSSNNVLSGNNVTANNGGGIYLYSSSNNILSGNSATASNGDGIALGSSSSNNVLSGNNVTNNAYGIRLDSSSNNVLSGNNVTNNGYGIKLGYSSNSTLSGNNITNNADGILLDSSSNNTFYHNSFINNTQHVHIETAGHANSWDNGYPSGGNYWSDYNGTEANHDGIGDTPYVIDANNIDNYPLMTQYVIPEYPSIQTTMFFILLTLLTVIIYKKKGVKTSQS